MGDVVTHIIIANDLRTGEIVYMTGEGSWTDEISTARRFEGGEEEVDAKIDGLRGSVSNTVVGIEVIALKGPSALESPVSFRDRIRAKGPTVRPDLARTP